MCVFQEYMSCEWDWCIHGCISYVMQCVYSCNPNHNGLWYIEAHATCIQCIQCMQDGADSNGIELLATLTSRWLLLTINNEVWTLYHVGPLSTVGIQCEIQLNQSR